MNVNKFLSLSVICLATSSSSAAECGMVYQALHSDTGTKIYQSPDGIPSIYYEAKVAVNTDGTARSYSPTDLRGTHHALNNIVNAMTGMYVRQGGDEIANCPKDGCFSGWVNAFQSAIDSNFDTHQTWVETKHIIPWHADKAGKVTPCTQTIDGQTYYVSQTAYPWPDQNGICNQNKYLDALTYNANVLPSETGWSSQGTITDGFDLVVWLDHGQVVFGINGDRGPRDSIGEVSVAAAAQMSANTQAAFANYEQVKNLALPSAQYLIFPKVDLQRMFAPKRFTQEDVNRVGAEVFGEWGGVDRLSACSGLDQAQSAFPPELPKPDHWTNGSLFDSTLSDSDLFQLPPGPPGFDPDAPLPPITVTLQSAVTMDMDCGFDGCIRGCMAKVSVENLTDLHLAWAGISFSLPSPNEPGTSSTYEISATSVSPGKTAIGAQETRLATCEQIDFSHPRIECLTESETYCESMIRYKSSEFGEN